MKLDPSQAAPSVYELNAAEQDHLAQILDDYLQAAERGTPITPEELLARHPDDAEQLRGYLSGLELFHRVANPRSSRSGSPRTLLGGGVQADDIIGDFRLVREIGRGGMGVVYEAEQISLRRRVALKLLPFSAGHDEKQISRFRNEAQAAGQIKHPNIVPVYAIGEERGVHYYAMQLIEGRSLATAISGARSGGTSAFGSTAPMHATATRTDRRASTVAKSSAAHSTVSETHRHVRDVARIGVQAAEALNAAHEYGIVHRDVKPSNLLLDGDGKLWVTDFGLARCHQNDGLTRTGDVLGTMRYMSPEQALGRGELVDHRTDIYSLGVTLYELATHHHPAGDVTDAQLMLDRRRFSSKPLRHWNRHIPVDFQTIVLKSIAEFPGERYGSARELADDLNRFLEGKPIHASPPSFATLAGKWILRHRRVVIAAAAVLILGFIGQFANTLLLTSQKRATEQALVRANENLRRAHSVLDRFGTRYAEQLAAIPGAEGVRAQMLEDSLDFYEEFEQLTAGEPTLRAELARAYNQMGTLHETLGDSRQALARHTAARAIWQEQLSAQPGDRDVARKLALCENNLGQLQAELGQSSEALVSLRGAQNRLRELLDKEPGSQDLATDFATTCNNLGLLLRDLGNRAEAVQTFRTAIDEQESLATRATNEIGLRVLAASYNNLGSLLGADAADEAARHYHQAIAIQRQLVEANPINRLYQGDLARSYNNLGFVLARQQDWRNAELCYLDAIKLQEHLVEQAPLAGSYTRDLAISYNNLGMVQSRDKRPAAAEESFEKSIALQRRLLKAMPSDARTLSNLGGAYNNLGLLLEAQHRTADAEVAYQSAIEFQKQALAAAPERSRYRELLGNHYANYAKCLVRQKKQQAADQIAAERTSLLAGRAAHGSD